MVTWVSFKIPCYIDALVEALMETGTVGLCVFPTLAYRAVSSRIGVKRSGTPCATADAGLNIVHPKLGTCKVAFVFLVERTQNRGTVRSYSRPRQPSLLSRPCAPAPPARECGLEPGEPGLKIRGRSEGSGAGNMQGPPCATRLEAEIVAAG